MTYLISVFDVKDNFKMKTIAYCQIYVLFMTEDSKICNHFRDYCNTYT